MAEKYDAIVLGTGGIGSAALYHLSKHSKKVLGLDRFPGGHDRGSSHGETRVIRQAYFEHPDYVPLLLRGYELWQELESSVSKQLYSQVGLLEVGPENGMLINGVLDAAQKHGLDVEHVLGKEMAERFPGFTLPEGFRALFEPTAGYLLVEECVKAHLELAGRNGAEIRTGEEVQIWFAKENGLVTVRTDQGEYETERLIITSGAWANDFLKDLNLNLRVVRKHLHWYACEKDSPYDESQGCPTFFYETHDGCFYGFPVRNEKGLKLAEHTGGEPVNDPLKLDHSVDMKDRKRVEEFLIENLPGVFLNPTDHKVCMYTLSPDEHFIIDHHPDYPQVVFAAGLSGHGFKFASVLGEVLADLAWEGKSNLPVEFLRRR